MGNAQIVITHQIGLQLYLTILVLTIAFLVMRVLHHPITILVNVRIAMKQAAHGRMPTSIIVDSRIVSPATRELLLAIISQDNAPIAIIQIAAGVMLPLTIVETLIALPAMLEVLPVIIIQGSVQTAMGLPAGRVQDLITVAFPIASRAT